MKSKFRIIRRILIVFLMVIIFVATPYLIMASGYRIPHKSNVTGFPGGNIYFNMSPSALERILGKPDDIINDTETPYDDYRYTQTVSGIKSQVTYGFFRSRFGRQLTKIDAGIPVSSAAEGKKLFDKIYPEMEKVYAAKPNYFNKGITKNAFIENQFTANFGTDDGATGIDVNITCSDKEVSVNIFDLY